MKKIISLLVIWVFLSSNVFALYDKIDESEARSLDMLSKTYESLKSEYESSIDSISDKKNYKILKSLGEINFDNINSSLIDSYFNYEDYIIDSYSDLTRDYRSLARQYDHSIIDEDQYESEKSKLDRDIQLLSWDIYDDVDLFYNTYLEDIESIESDYLTYVDENSSLIWDVESNLDDISAFYSQFSKLYDKVDLVNSVYVWSSATIHDFVDRFEERTSGSMSWSLESIISSNYSRYSNLKNVSWDSIQERKQILLDNYSRDLNNHFENLIDWFFDESVYSEILEYKEYIDSNYFNDDESYNYSNIVDMDISRLEDKIYETNSQLSKIESRLEDFDNADDYDSIRESLLSSSEKFYKSELESKKESLESFIDREIEFLTLKSSRQLDSYNSIISDIEELESLSYNERISKIDSIVSSIESRVDDFVDFELKADLEDKKWQLLVDQIDYKIRDKWLTRFNIQYQNIEDLLLNILNNMSEESWDAERFEERVEEAILRADELLLSWSLSARNEYQLLRIKQSMIRFLYL